MVNVKGVTCNDKLSPESAVSLSFMKLRSVMLQLDIYITMFSAATSKRGKLIYQVCVFFCFFLYVNRLK